MSSVIVEPRSLPDKVHRPITGRSRWVAGGLLVTGGLLQVVEFLLESPPDDSAARVATWVVHPASFAWSNAAGLLAVPFLLAGVAVLVALTRPFSRRLAWVAAGFMTFGLAGLAAVHGMELAAYGLARSGDTAAATAVLTGDHLGLPGAVLFVMFLGGAALGTLTLATAMWRSRYLPRVAPVPVVAFAMLDFAAGWSVVSHTVLLASDVTVAIALVTGYFRGGRGSGE
jgi:hypothetical protein